MLVTRPEVIGRNLSTAHRGSGVRRAVAGIIAAFYPFTDFRRTLVENTSETIAILGGTGDLGTGLAIRWSKAGHKIIIGSRTLEKAQTAVANLQRIQLGLDHRSWRQCGVRLDGVSCLCRRRRENQSNCTQS